MLANKIRNVTDIGHVIDHFAHDLFCNDGVIILTVGITAGHIADAVLTGAVGDNPVGYQVGSPETGWNVTTSPMA